MLEITVKIPANNSQGYVTQSVQVPHDTNGQEIRLQLHYDSNGTPLLHPTKPPKW